MKPLVFLLIAVAAAFGASQVVQSLQDYSTTAYASTTDMLIARKDDRRPRDRSWPPSRSYLEHSERDRDTLARTIIGKKRRDPEADLCSPTGRQFVVGVINRYLALKLAWVRYPLHIAGEEEARNAELDWKTRTTTEAEAIIVEYLKSGLLSVYELSDDHTAEARRMLGSFNTSRRKCSVMRFP
jgi:hypothetical protein